VRIAQLSFALACIVVGFFLGERYISRLPDHAGYFLVPVADEVRAALPSRPRHTAFIVVDGLRRDAAEGMAVTRLLEKAGQCRVSDQGSFTVSRPEYALLSTGLEVDRTGSRNNDLTTPLAAESIWQVARASGLSVSGSSHLPWFKQLFPGGFDRFTTLETHAANVFAEENGALLDVNVFHPLYVDENGHHHGAASSEYAAAVARVDLEIAGLLERIAMPVVGGEDDRPGGPHRRPRASRCGRSRRSAARDPERAHLLRGRGRRAAQRSRRVRRAEHRARARAAAGRPLPAAHARRSAR
jgi:hypothetical protein